MGPELYNQLEALKAQAVAARTYTLRNMGEFSREGYDICATPRCQVYGGMTVEHPLSDQAVAETAGQILLYKGELVNALYSSTCGGHTEDVNVMFPLQQEPYLKGVPCMEAGIARVDGELGPGVPFPAGFTRRLLPPSAGSPAVDALAARLEHLALLAGLPAPRERLAGLDRREVQRYIASAFDLALDARLFLAPEDVKYLLSNPPADWTPEERRRAAYLMRSGLVSGPLDQPLSESEIERTLLALAELLRVVRREEVSFLSVADGKLTVRSGQAGGQDLPPLSRPRHLPAPGGRALQRAARHGARGPADPLLAGGAARRRHPGDRPRRRGVRPQQPLQLVDPLPHRLATRHPGQHPLPGLGFQSFDILSRGVSGRVGKIRIEGDAGKTMEVDGLAVRWTLDVPDTLFTARRLAPKGQEPGWQFTGRGFGHGVGMCQVGAYGMAQRGHTYREILLHYYSGVELGAGALEEARRRGGTGGRRGRGRK